MPAELNVKLALENVWMVDGILPVVMKDAAKMTVTETDFLFLKISFSQ